MREWLIRIGLRGHIRTAEIPHRTLAPLLKGDWVTTVETVPQVVILVARGHEWVQAFREGEKSIGGGVK